MHAEEARRQLQEDKGEHVDWRALLAEGEEVWRPGSESELSEWTESEEEEETGQEGAGRAARLDPWLEGLEDKRASPALAKDLTDPSEADAWIRDERIGFQLSSKVHRTVRRDIFVLCWYTRPQAVYAR